MTLTGVKQGDMNGYHNNLNMSCISTKSISVETIIKDNGTQHMEKNVSDQVRNKVNEKLSAVTFQERAVYVIF